MKIVGDKRKMAICIGDYFGNSIQHQHIDTWIANRLINSFDNCAYLPTYYSHLKQQINWLMDATLEDDFSDLSDDEIYHNLDNGNQTNQILAYDITLNDANCYIFKKQDIHRIVFSFFRNINQSGNEIGIVHGVDIKKQYLLDVLTETLRNLSSKWV